MAYDPSIIEPKWQRHWREHKVFATLNRPGMPKYYILDQIPYPSGVGLHVGHVEPYTASDVIARFMRMRGYDVLHPMGWDAFGLPAEQHAIEMAVHPADSTESNVRTFRSQLDMLGLSYDWDRQINTSSPEYYRWTQWIFLKMLECGLAYRAESLVNWCPGLGTVLANDEIVDGKSERGGHPVIRKMMPQWMLRITAYAERLLEGLERVDFPLSIKEMQRDRIGRSEGADILFPIAGLDEHLEVFTTRPDTIFGVTFCVLAPEHPLVGRVTTPHRRSEVEAYKRQAASKSDMDRAGSNAGKTGVFTGSYAINPLTGERIPIWLADYVLVSHGTGAIMCVPGHDGRDWSFARHFKLPVKEVIGGGNVYQAAWEGEGTLVNSGFLNGMDTRSAIDCAIAAIEDKGIGRRKVRYRIRDWVFARQRYWGEPVPVVYDEDQRVCPLPESELPLLLPRLEDFQPSGQEEAPLARLKDWVYTTVPGTGRPGFRETHTMPTLAGSSWYFLRYIDPSNGERIVDPGLARRWMPVDLYIGGAEHAVGHLLYSRFFTKFLYDLGISPVDEPFARLVTQGMILGEDHRKMGKRYGNVVDPADVVRTHGADALRLYEMFMGPIDADKPWSTAGLDGMRRFLERVWRLFFDEHGRLHSSIDDSAPTPDVSRLLHMTIDKVAKDTANLRFNTALAQMMTFVNAINQQAVRPRAAMEKFVLLLAPYAPHIAEELWQRLGRAESLVREPFPEADPAWLVQERYEIAVQVNGKICGRLQAYANQTQDEVLQAALAEDTVKARIADREILKIVYVPKRLVSISVRSSEY